MRRAVQGVGALVLGLLGSIVASGKTPPGTPEQQAAAYFDSVATSPPQLRVFLQAMPKGGDLHNHMGGSVYAEDFIAWADADGFCIDADTNAVVAPPCDDKKRIPARGLAARDYQRYSRIIDAMSTRGIENGVGDPEIPGHDRFFGSFDAYSVASRPRTASVLAAAREVAAGDHVSYIELITMPRPARDLFREGFPADDPGTDFAALTARIVPLLPPLVAETRANFDRFESEAAAAQGCSTPTPSPACAVEVRYQMGALRNQPPARVFGMLSFAFAMVEADPRVVAVNLVTPEHEPVPVRDYALHMQMLSYLRGLHPTVPLSLHAGELTLGLVPPRDLRFHIHDAVAIAGARRIGHGADIAYETDAAALLRRMAREKIPVEINLSSNAVILNVKGKDHPLSLYRAAGVPLVLSTDDEGVARSDMTNEYLRAAREQGLRYRDLKEIARNSLEYAFLPGASLWKSKVGGPPVPTCAVTRVSPDAACEKFLAASPKARQQWQLERAFQAFETEQRYRP